MQFLIPTIIIFSSFVFGHIEVETPGPFRGRFNNNTKNIDYDGTNPLTGIGQFPCKGYHSAMTDPTGEGKPTALWKQGAPATIKLTKGGLHTGGSCQASLSYDGGTTFTAIYSMQGNCPTSDMAFTVPADAPVGPAIGSWTWFNRSGNREMYQNCFSATIEATTGAAAPATPFAQRPLILVANLGGSCKTAEMMDVRFPNPGPDVTGAGDANSLIGDCGVAAPVAPVPQQPADHIPDETLDSSETPAKSDLGSITSLPTRIVPAAPSPSSVSFSFSSIPIPIEDQLPNQPPAPAPPTTSAAVVPVVPTRSPTSAVIVPVPGESTPVASSAVPKPTGGAPSGGISTDGSCGSTAGKTCASPNCCSQGGWCGTSSGHCGTGCQAQFGVCAAGGGKLRRHRDGLSG